MRWDLIGGLWGDRLCSMWVGVMRGEMKIEGRRMSWFGRIGLRGMIGGSWKGSIGYWWGRCFEQSYVTNRHSSQRGDLGKDSGYGDDVVCASIIAR